MSLEQALKENTEAIRALTAALNQTPVVSEPAAVVPAAEPLKYEAIQKPFLKLVSKNRPTAVALLSQLGLKKLDGVQPEQYAEVLKMIEEKFNG